MAQFTIFEDNGEEGAIECDLCHELASWTIDKKSLTVTVECEVCGAKLVF